MEKQSEIRRIFEGVSAVRRYSKGELIYRQGDDALNFYYLKKGRARVFMTSPDGNEKTLSTASNGEILGEAAFFDRMPRVSSASALTAVEVAVINEQMLLGLIKSEPQLALELLKMEAVRIRQLSNQLDAMTFQQADARIAQLLSQSMRSERGELVVSLTHEEIAGIVGVSRVTVSKILNRFARDGVIKTAYRKIIILNTEKLTS